MKYELYWRKEYTNLREVGALPIQGFKLNYQANLIQLLEEISQKNHQELQQISAIQSWILICP